LDENHAFKASPTKVYLTGLIDSLRKEKVPDPEFAWMIGPHAYHLIPATHQLINQYAPGTSYLLSITGISLRQMTFPAIVMMLFILIALSTALMEQRHVFTWFDFYFPVLCIVMVSLIPFKFEFQRINSLAPTFGFLFAAGMILRSKPC
jgi:hypothetical protein